VLHRLGLAIPEDMAGRLPAELLEPEELERRPPRWSASRSAIQPELKPADLELDPDEQAALIQRLRALGYVE
jgi:hypothetical protein